MSIVRSHLHAAPLGERRVTLFSAYVAFVIAGGLSAIAISWAQLSGPVFAGHEAAVAAFALCLIVAELCPMNWLSLQDGGEVTASWTFALCLLFVAEPPVALMVMSSVCLLVELVRRKPLVRAAFNAGQMSLSLLPGAWVFHALTDLDKIDGNGWDSVLWLAATLLTAVVTFACNSLYTCVVLALHQRLPILPVIRKSVGVNLMMDGLLLALAPVFAVIALRSLLLVPLLLATVWIIYRSAVLALRNRHEATHDLLTGLPNRREFDEQAGISVDAARRRGETLVLIQIDLDGFKAINDRLGHHYGDLVLRVVADRLLAAKRPTDLVARLGGDEFAILLRDVGDAATAEVAACRFRDAITPSMTIEGLPLSVGGSFGVAVFPEHGEDLPSLLHNADMAMYRAKSQGLGVSLFASESTESRPARATLLAELSRALDEHELFLHYQPRVDLFTGRVVGVEALVRWNHPRLGVVQPAAFMAQAEQSDLIGALTERVVRLAVAQAASWRRQGIELTVSVNASARNLIDFRFPAMVAAALAEHCVDPAALELEITENSMLVDPVRTTTVLAWLRSVGVTISVDDFGTGYSSLASLRDLTIDHVKIDRSFVSGMPERPGDLMIVRSIIDLAHNLGLGTVAEGAERIEELEVLRAMGCDAVQGYLLAPPSTPEELDRRLRVGFDLDALRPVVGADFDYAPDAPLSQLDVELAVTPEGGAAA